MKPQDRYNLFMEGLIKRNPGEIEFHQAVKEFAQTIIPHINDNKVFIDNQIIERLTEPDRIIIFRVVWEDDQGNVRTNRGYRVQFNNAVGPYKGGLRFHPSVNLSILKFLGFEQIFKNSLTGLPIGGAKGGANFNPKGKSDREIMRFCQAFMNELYRHIGTDVDVPAGDIGVGAKEVGYLYGQYKRLKNNHTGVITGKSIDHGGSLIRTEATGYGCVYFADNMLQHHSDSLQGKTVTVSGSGNVAQYTIEKLLHKGAKIVSVSDSGGTVYDPEGINEDKLAWIKEWKNIKRGRIEQYIKEFGGTYRKGKRPWHIPCDAAFPSATQNEISLDDAKELIKNGCRLVAEGANMPTDLAAADAFQQAKVLFAPAKAANAGGVAVSALEMSQNSMRISWSEEELDLRLQGIMTNIHEKCIEFGQEKNYINYAKGANIAGFNRAANAMLAYGVV